MALSGKKAQLKQQQQQQQQQQQHSQQHGQQHSQQRWLQDAVKRALIALKARGGSSLRAVQRYLQDACRGESRAHMLSTQRVRSALGEVARSVGAVWKLTDKPSCAIKKGSDERLERQQSAVASPPISPVNEAAPDSPEGGEPENLPEGAHCAAEEQRQYDRLKLFIQSCERQGIGHERRRAHFITARTLHGPVSLELSFLTSRRSLGLESTVFEDEMRGNIQVTLGASEDVRITGAVSMADGARAAVSGQLRTDGSATLRLGSLDLQTTDLATGAYSCLRRGGGYVDLRGSESTQQSPESTQQSPSLVRAYFMLAYTAA